MPNSTDSAAGGAMPAASSDLLDIQDELASARHVVHAAFMAVHSKYSVPDSAERNALATILNDAMERISSVEASLEALSTRGEATNA